MLIEGRASSIAIGGVNRNMQIGVRNLVQTHNRYIRPRTVPEKDVAIRVAR